MGNTKQSLVNLNDVPGNRAVMGSIRGAELTGDGLYTPPGVVNNWATPDSILDLTGDASIYHKFLRPWSELPVASLGALTGSESTCSDFSLRAANDPSALHAYWKNENDAWLAVSSAYVPDEAMGVACHRFKTGNWVYQVRFEYLTAAGDWLQFGPTSTLTTDSDVKPADVVLMIGAGSISARNFEHTTTEVILVNNGVTIASPDFAAQEPGAESFTDAQGVVWTVSTTGNDTNDPVSDIYAGVKYLRFDGQPSTSMAATGVNLGMAGATQSVIDWVRGEEGNVSSGLSMYTFYHSAAGSRFRPGLAGDNVARVQVTRSDTGSAYNLDVVYPGIRFKPVIQFVVDWDHNGPLIPRLTVLFLEDGTWITAGFFDAILACAQPDAAGAITVGHPTTAPTLGDLYRVEVFNDGVGVFSTYPDRDHVAGDTWVDPYSGRTLTPGNVNTPRLVTESALILDGIDNYIQMPPKSLPNWQKNSGGYSLYMRCVLYANAQFSRLFAASTSSAGTNLAAYPSGHGSEGRIYMSLLTSGGNDYLISNHLDYANGEEFTVIAVFDGDAMEMRFMTARDGAIKEDRSLAITPGGDPLPHSLVPRIGSRAYTVATCAEMELFECMTWDRALTEAEMLHLINP